MALAVMRVCRLAALLLALPGVLVGCTLYEVGEHGFRPTEAGILLAFLVIGVPALAAIQRSFLNPKCREPRRGLCVLGIEFGDDDGDGGCSD